MKHLIFIQTDTINVVFVAATSNDHKEDHGAPMTEAEKLQAAHDHKVSTAFDFMALCSAPTWLEGKKRKSRRRKNPLHSPLPSAATEVRNKVIGHLS